MGISYPLQEIEMDFELVGTVLDELYDRILLSGEKEKDRAIKTRLDSLSREYGHLAQGAIIDYSDPITRFAYIYCYVTAHMSIVYDLISNSSDLERAFNTHQVKVSCLGGGPGSELLGILKFMKMKNKSARLYCSVFDREKMWYESLKSVCNKLHTSFRVCPTFGQLDVLKSATWERYTTLWQTDLFTMSFFMSEIYSVRDTAEAFFVNLFKKAKSGSLFLVVDNAYEKYHNWFDILISTGGLNVLESRRVKFCTKDDKGALERYYQKFSHHCPRMTAKAAYRICRKV